MSSFRPKPAIPRPDAAAAVRIAQGVADLPLTTAPPVRPEPSPSGTKAPKVVQINFKATEGFADLLADLSAPYGGMRRFLAQLLANAGHPVPEADLNPPTMRRRGTGQRMDGRAHIPE